MSSDKSNEAKLLGLSNSCKQLEFSCNYEYHRSVKREKISEEFHTISQRQCNESLTQATNMISKQSEFNRRVKCAFDVISNMPKYIHGLFFDSFKRRRAH